MVIKKMNTVLHLATRDLSRWWELMRSPTFRWWNGFLASLHPSFLTGCPHSRLLALEPGFKLSCWKGHYESPRRPGTPGCLPYSDLSQQQGFSAEICHNYSSKVSLLSSQYHCGLAPSRIRTPTQPNSQAAATAIQIVHLRTNFHVRFRV